jgi:hypothetical protein
MRRKNFVPPQGSMLCSLFFRLVSHIGNDQKPMGFDL